MSARQITDWIQPAKAIRESKTLDDYLQRDLKDRRKAIAKYILSDEFHFFNSIVVGVFGGVPEWVEFDLSKFENHIQDSEIDLSQDSMGILIFDGDEQMFAIDGQHRVAGIQIATKEDEEKKIENQKLNDDQFSVVFVAHIDDDLGKKRTRKLFSDINKNAKPVAAGDKIKIDEEDICAIVTRRIYAQYHYFDEGKIIAVTENSNLDPRDVENFTNLTGLYTAIKILKKELFPIAKNKLEYDEEQVQGLLNISTDFFDFIISNQIDLKNFFVDKSLSLLEVRISKTNIIFRPVGLFLLARIYSQFYKTKDLDFLSENLNKINFEMPNSPFKDILWTSGKMETKSEKQILAFNISLYILGKYIGNQSDLLQKYREVVKRAESELPDIVVA